MKRLISYIITCISLSALSIGIFAQGTPIAYEYDNSGNRVARHIVTLKSYTVPENGHLP